MEKLLPVARAIDAVTEWVGKTVGWCILAAVLLSTGNAVVRKLFNTSSNAYLEAQWYLFGAAFLGAAAYTLRQNEHIRIDIIYGALSRRTQHWIDLLGHLFFLMPFVVLMDLYFLPYVLQSFRTGEMSNNAGGLILWPAKSLLLFGFALLTLQGLSEIIKKVAVMTGAMADPTPFVSAHESAELEGAALARKIAGEQP
jgi:TRAP-type mannitol/chloroaromatic compound transport system permease small subunit